MSNSFATPATSPPGSSTHGISQARILEWVAIFFSRGSAWPRNQTCIYYLAGRFFFLSLNHWATLLYSYLLKIDIYSYTDIAGNCKAAMGYYPYQANTELIYFSFPSKTLMIPSWRRKWQPTPVFLPGESQGRGSLLGCHLWGRTESDTTEVT